ncbi:hypothetical protein ACFWIW_27740 [Amycolatopsis sp. NPDC058340]|uniref:hypothetical protein n=1 Tax=Amycolatopsis sp. NPDC058340 TaxID=3346453 RepID=UPI003655C7AF
MWELIGAGAFGFVLGWNLYFVNRYRTGEIGLSDLAALLGAVGGGAVLALFPAGSRLFGAYGIGLAAGFFAYLVVLLIMVARSDDFGVEWFLDGRRRKLADEDHIPAETRASGAPMSREDSRLPS